MATQDFPYVFLDATYCKARVGHRILSQAVVVADGVAADARWEVLGFDVGDVEGDHHQAGDSAERLKAPDTLLHRRP